MEIEAKGNRLINEIMSNSSPVTILLSSSDGESVGFVSDLSNCYKNTFWFNTEYDNMYSFTISLAKKILKYDDDDATLNKLMQFKYCQLEYNKDNIILEMILNRIEALPGDCLLVLDNLELLPEDFNFKLIELLITRCPKNLKILLISEKFLDLNYNLFEPNCPKFIDEISDNVANENDFLDLEKLGFSNEELAFLCYISQIRHVDKEFVKQIYDKGNDCLNKLSKHDKRFVFCKGNDLFWINPKINTYLSEVHSELENSSFFEKNIYDRLTEHYISIQKYIKAIKISLDRKLFSTANKVIKLVFDSDFSKFKINDFAKSVSEVILDDADLDNNWYCEYLKCLIAHYKDDYNYTLKLVEKLISKTPRYTILYYDIHFMLFHTMALSGRKKDAAERCYKLILDDLAILEKDNNVIFLQSLLGIMPTLLRNTNNVLSLSLLKRFESLVLKEEYSVKYWYPKILQSDAESYFDLGHYRKAIEIIDKLKSYLPFYTIPHRLIEYYYYLGDINKANSTARDCLSKAETYSFSESLTSIYTVLAKSSAFYGKYDEALKFIEKAVKCDYSSETEKYQAISIRALIYARMGKVDYAKDIATIYAKICELNAPKYTYIFYAALSYCYWKQNELTQAKNYSNKCLAAASIKTGIWFLATGITLSCLISEDEIRDKKSLLNKFFNSCISYNMQTVLVDYFECFESPVNLAKQMGLFTDFIGEVESLLNDKNNDIAVKNKLLVRFFGTTMATVNGKEIVWKTKKTKELFMLLIWMGVDGIDRGKILETLWKDYVYISGLNNLKTTNNIIRNTLASYNINCKLNYLNGRYMLFLPNMETDYSVYKNILDGYKDTLTIKQRIDLLKKAVLIYMNGFANEISNDIFQDIRNNLQSDLVLHVFRLAEDLLNNGDIIEAKRFMGFLEKINDGEIIDTSRLNYEIENKLKRIK